MQIFKNNFRHRKGAPYTPQKKADELYMVCVSPSELCGTCLQLHCSKSYIYKKEQMEMLEHPMQIKKQDPTILSITIGDIPTKRMLALLQERQGDPWARISVTISTSKKRI